MKRTVAIEGILEMDGLYISAEYVAASGDTCYLLKSRRYAKYARNSTYQDLRDICYNIIAKLNYGKEQTK